MASVSAVSDSARVTFNVTAAVERSGSIATVSLKWALSGSAYYGAGIINGTTITSKKADWDTWIDVGGSGTKKYTYEGPESRDITYTISAVAQGQQRGEHERNSTSLSVHIDGVGYSITFNPEGGQTPVSTKTVVYGEPYGDLPTPTRSGYSFLGWYSSLPGGALITSGTVVTNTEPHTLYAKWEPLSILHLVSGGQATTVTQIYDVSGGQVQRVTGVYSVQDGVVKQGI